MKHRIFYYKPFKNGIVTKVTEFSLFQNRAGYTTYNLEVDKFDRHPDTNSGWVGRAYDPEEKKWVDFPYRAHCTDFHIYNGCLPGPEKAFSVLLVAEDKWEEALITNCQACVRWEPWAFQVCLIPGQDFFPVS